MSATLTENHQKELAELVATKIGAVFIPGHKDNRSLFIEWDSANGLWFGTIGCQMRPISWWLQYADAVAEYFYDDLIEGEAAHLKAALIEVAGIVGVPVPEVVGAEPLLSYEGLGSDDDDDDDNYCEWCGDYGCYGGCDDDEDDWEDD